MQGDGNGWVRCALGHRHWGRFGAAGVLVTDTVSVLLQHRAEWTHEGGTWAVPGGARDSHEAPVDAALREAAEETSLNPADVVPAGSFVAEHGGWSYTTIVALTAAVAEVRPGNAETAAVTWWPIGEVAALPLHSGFAAAWPHLHRLIDQLGSGDSRPAAGDAPLPGH